MSALSRFLQEVATRPFEWGRCDCCLILADWLVACAGVDPAADLRAAYVDEDAAADVVEAEGGLVALLERRLARVGMTRTGTPQSGDVAAVALGGAQLLFGAIACESGWAIKSRRGLIISRLPRPVACWTFASA